MAIYGFQFDPFEWNLIMENKTFKEAIFEFSDKEDELRILRGFWEKKSKGLKFAGKIRHFIISLPI